MIKPPHDERERAFRSRWRLGEHTSPFETGGRSRTWNQKHVTRHSGESQRGIARTCISQQTPCLSFVNCWGNIILLRADDRSFWRWCSDGQETRNICLSNQTLSFSSPMKIRTDSWIGKLQKKTPCSYLPLWKDSWKKHGGRLSTRLQSASADTDQWFVIGRGQRQQALSSKQTLSFSFPTKMSNDSWIMHCFFFFVWSSCQFISLSEKKS